MKSSTLLLLLFSILIMASYGCSGDSPTDPNTNPEPDDSTGTKVEAPTAEAFQSLQDDAQKSRRQTAQFRAEDGISFTSDKGVKLKIAPKCLTLDGDSVKGQVDLEYSELFNRSDMLVSNRPTMGIMANGDKKMLISGGEFFINAYQNGKKLKTKCGIQLEIPAHLTGGADQDMTLWKGVEDSSGNLSWDQKRDSTGNAQGNGRLQVKGNMDGTYYAFLNGFGKTNVDRFYSDPRPKTMVKATVPDGYNFDNSSVFLSYDGEPNALAKLDTYIESTQIFSEHYGQVPIGLEMHVIFMSEDNGQWRYAIKGVTVAQGDQYDFTLSETTVGSEQDVLDAIDALP